MVSTGQTAIVLTFLFPKRAPGTQETAVTLIGLVLGTLCAQGIASSALHAMALFLFLTGVHVWANYQAVYSLHVLSVNPSRAHLMAKEALALHEQSRTAILLGDDDNSCFDKLVAASTKFGIAEVIIKCS